MSTSRLACSLSTTTTATTACATLMRRWLPLQHCDLNASFLTASLSQRQYFVSVTAVSRANASSSSRGGGAGIPGEPRKSSTRLTKRSAASGPITSPTTPTKIAQQDNQTAAAASAPPPPSSQTVATTSEITQGRASIPPHETMGVSMDDRQQKVKKESEVISTSSLDSSDPRATTAATTMDQLRTALVHLTRRTTSLATDIGDLRHLVTEANTSSRVAAMTSTTSQNAIDELNVTIQRLEGLLEQCERSASQSALRWERLDVSSGGTSSNITHSALADAAGSVFPSSSSATTSAHAASHLAASSHAPRNVDDNIPPPPLASLQPLRSTNDESSTARGAVHHVGGGVVDSRQLTNATQRTEDNGQPNATTQYLLSRIEMLSSTVASLVQQQQRSGHHPLPPSPASGSAGAESAGPSLQLAPSSVVAISATLCPTTNLLTVAGSQVVVSNIPAVVSASAIRTWCYAVGPVLSIIVLPQSRKNRTLQQHRASTTGSSSPQASGTDVKSMLVTFATVEDANRAVQRLHGYAWAGSSLQSAPPQQQGHGDKTFFNRQHFVLSVELFQQHDAAAAAALALIPISLTTTTTTTAAATLQ